jgi:hypothetical protein
MINNIARVGNFTSSEIVALTKVAKDGKSFGAPALTYIAECNMERRLGRSLTDEVNARPLVWGKFLEAIVFELLGLEYSLISKDTIVHPTIPFWSGSPDGMKEEDTVIDIKCPITLKSFCQLVDPLYDGLTGIDAMNAVRDNHKDGEKYYWQLVSNSILTGAKYAELIVYMPYQSELASIRSMAEGNGKAYFIWASSDDELPYMPDNGYYENVNIIRFEVPQDDKVFLTAKVIEAGKMLINPGQPVVQEFDPSALLTKIN